MRPLASRLITCFLASCWLCACAGPDAHRADPPATVAAPAAKTTPPPRDEPAASEPAKLEPEANARFRDPALDVEEWAKRFEGDGREIYDQRDELLRVSGVRPGMAVADVGAGTGLFTMLFARAVGRDGQVYAVDISPRFLEHIGKRAAESGQTQVRTIMGTARSTELPPASIDLAFICDTYHHFEYPESVMRSLHRALRPGGEIMVIDFHREPGKTSAFSLQHVRAGESTFRAEIESVGFDFLSRHDILKDNYVLRFRKR